MIEGRFQEAIFDADSEFGRNGNLGHRCRGVYGQGPRVMMFGTDLSVCTKKCNSSTRFKFKYMTANIHAMLICPCKTL